MIRLLLIDDHGVFRESLSRAISVEADFEVHHCATVAEGLQIAATVPVDIVLLDFDLGLERGSDFIMRARAAGFEGRILIVTAWVDDSEALELIRQGISGIFLKESPLASLVASIRTVAAGGAVLDQHYLRLLAAADSEITAPEDPSRPRFSDRESAIMRLLLDGLSNKELGARLGMSESAVKAALQRLFEKTGVRTRSQLVRIALEQVHSQPARR